MTKSSPTLVNTMETYVYWSIYTHWDFLIFIILKKDLDPDRFEFPLSTKILALSCLRSFSLKIECRKLTKFQEKIVIKVSTLLLCWELKATTRQINPLFVHGFYSLHHFFWFCQTYLVLLILTFTKFLKFVWTLLSPFILKLLENESKNNYLE